MQLFEKLTPVLVVEEIEPCLGFWQGLGFTRADEVREGDKLGFVILRNGGVEVMYQSRESLAKDAPQLASQNLNSPNILYLAVKDVEKVAAKLPPQAIVVPMRTTFYGAREIFAREPGGNLVGFAQFE